MATDEKQTQGKFVTWERFSTDCDRSDCLDNAIVCEREPCRFWSALPAGVPETPLTRGAEKLLKACKQVSIDLWDARTRPAQSLYSRSFRGARKLDRAIAEAEGREAP